MPSGDVTGEEAFYDPDNTPLMAIQNALVLRLLDETAGRYGHVIYEIGNEINHDSETRKAAKWQQHWIEVFRRYEREHGVELLLTNDTHLHLFAAGGDGFDIVNHHGHRHLLIKGQPLDGIARDVRTAVLEDFRRFQRPVVNSRPCSDPDRTNYPDIVSESQGRCLYWSYFMSGGHIIGFRTTLESWKGGLKAETIIRHLRAFIDRVPFERMAPAEVVAEGTALCLAAPGEVYAFYLPVGGEIAIDLGEAEGDLAARWYDPRTGQWRESFHATGGRIAPFAAPDGQDWVLLLKAD